jgi:hypothetical protein
MREAALEKTDGFSTLKRDLARLTQAICDYGLGQTSRAAAE